MFVIILIVLKIFYLIMHKTFLKKKKTIKSLVLLFTFQGISKEYLTLLCKYCSRTENNNKIKIDTQEC